MSENIKSNLSEENVLREKILVTRSSMPSMDEYMNEIKTLWDTHWLTNMGPKHNEFTDKLREFLGVENIDLLVNGHMALEMTLQAMNLQGEVITSPFTFASTTHAIVRNGLMPVFCDINPTTYTIDTDKIEDLITDRTCAIMPIHVYGNICDVKKIDRIAKKYGLKVIYDACHAFGETYKGRNVASFGDASVFSFHATKVFNSIEGGAVCYKEKSMGELLWGLKNFGIHGPEDVNAVGANAKMNEFCAAMGICNLRHIEENIQRRKIVAERYDERLNGLDGIQLNAIQEGLGRNYGYYPIVIDEKRFGSSREEVFDVLVKNGIGARKYFYPITNSFAAFHGKFDVNKTPVALHISKRVLTLPMYANLSLEVVDCICDIILKCKRKRGV